MQISVSHILASRAPDRTIPPCLVRYLERLIHQDRMNAFLSQYGHLRDYDFLDAFLTDGLHVSLPTAPSHLPPSIPRPLFVANHPLGGLDGIILLLLLHRMGYDARAIVNDLLLQVTPIANLFVPVNKIGRQQREYVLLQHELWQSDSPILSFPAGACSRKQHGEIKDLTWRPTFIRNAIRYERAVIPIRFFGQNSPRFYRIAQLRKALHIPFNIEMLLLPDEMFRAQGARFNVRFGNPIPHQNLADLSPEYFRQLIYQL